MALAAGTRLGPYEILEPLGAGGMGEVYRARDTRLGREVAVKVLPAELSHDRDRLHRFEQEARLAGSLNHPGVLTVYDVGSHEGAPYLVTELLEGRSLREALQGGPLPTRKAVEYGRQVAHGLAAAHAREIVHRDVKPANVFITKDGRAKILDFGLAKLAQLELLAAGSSAVPTQTAEGRIAGTVGYMAPEQVRGQTVDARSDIFAFGAVLYEMLTGNRAFRGETTADTLTAILTKDPEELSRPGLAVPASLERIVRRCLEKDAEERFQSARDVAFALEAESGPSRPGTEPATVTIRPRRRWLVASAVGVALVIGGALGLWSGRAVWERPFPKTTPLTYRLGLVDEARFLPDGKTVVYSAFWDGNPPEIFTTRVESRGSRSLGLPPARLLSVSSTGELAILLKAPGDLSPGTTGTLARVPFSGGEPRRVLENVLSADWSPDGRELAVIRRVEGEFQLEYPIGNVLGRGGRYFQIRTSPRGDSVAVVEDAAVGERQGITVYDRTRRKTLVQTPPHVLGLAWPLDDGLWFTAGESFGHRSVWRGKPTGPPSELYRDIKNLTLHDASSDGRLLVHLGFERMVVRAKAPGEKGERDLGVLGSRAMDLSADGSRALISDGSAPVQTYVRPTHGGPAVRLGEGVPLALSPAGTWVLVASPDPHPRLVLTPTGPGEPRPLASDGFERTDSAWFLDEGRLLIDASSAGQRSRSFLVDVSGGERRAITPEGIVSIRGSYHDGAVIGVAADGTLARYPLQDGDAQPMAARLPSGAVPLRVSGDERFLFVARERIAMPYWVDRLELATGRLTPWKTLQPEDATGVTLITGAVLTPDGDAYAYTYERDLHGLYLVEGLRR